MIINEMQNLYKVDLKGRVNVFWIEISDTPSLHIHHGLLGGKIQEDIDGPIQGKNIGKSNETSPEQQAELEAKSRYNKKKDQGYKESIEEAQNSIGTDAEGKVKPMLAYPYDAKKHKDYFPCYVQPKLDGVRCLIHIDFSINYPEIKAYSREGKEYDIKAFSKGLYSTSNVYNDLLDLYNFHRGTHTTKIILDGELYAHKESFENFISIVKAPYKATREELEKIEYHIYDIIFPNGKQNFAFRNGFLNGFINDKLNLTHIKKVETKQVEDFDSAKLYFSLQIEQGYEGIMLRSYLGTYDHRRSNNLLKYKEFQTEEFEIIDIEEGTGRESGAAIYVCWADGKLERNPNTGDKSIPQLEFKCRPQGTIEKRKEIFANKKQYIGKMLTVKFQEYTENGIPRFPVGITIRDYE